MIAVIIVIILSCCISNEGVSTILAAGGETHIALELLQPSEMTITVYVNTDQRLNGSLLVFKQF